jgi:hypothetical protein
MAGLGGRRGRARCRFAPLITWPSPFSDGATLLQTHTIPIQRVFEMLRCDHATSLVPHCVCVWCARVRVAPPTPPFSPDPACNHPPERACRCHGCGTLFPRPPRTDLVSAAEANHALRCDVRLRRVGTEKESGGPPPYKRSEQLGLSPWAHSTADALANCPRHRVRPRPDSRAGRTCV